MTETSFHPEGTIGAPPQFTAVGWRYRLQIFLVLAYLGLIALLYLGLLGGAGYLLYRSIQYIKQPQGEVLFGYVGIAGAALLLLFLGRPLFRRIKVDRSIFLEIDSTNQPMFFAFLHQLCQEVDAPFPRKVYLSPEVNAAVFRSVSLFNLIFPVRQDLVIGLGLVNTLNLTEFKAVLAHEFGHFSQKSIRIGPYVYTSSRIIGEVIGRSERIDFLLRRLSRWTSNLLEVVAVDVRLLLIVLPLLLVLYLLIGLVKGFAAVLQWLHRLLNLANLSLLRQMEFNADLVAVSVVGSDAPIDVLVRLPLADQALGQTAQDLVAAAETGLYTRDLFYHQGHAVAFCRRSSGNPQLGEPPPSGGAGPRADIFKPEDATVPRMWSTHPSNYEREQNAKRSYLRGPIDERPAWVLFQEAPNLCAKITYRFYQHLLERALIPNPAEPEAVQAFIDAEHAVGTYHPRYYGLYDDRYLDPGEPVELAEQARADSWSPDQLSGLLKDLYPESLSSLVANYRQSLQELRTLGEAEGQAEFEFRGQKYQLGDAVRLQKQVRQELEELRLKLAAIDRQVFLVHFQLASVFNAGTAQELITHYRFHLGIQAVCAKINESGYWIQSVLNFLSQNREITQESYHEIVNGTQSLCCTLREDLEAAERRTMPELKNVAPGRPLHQVLLGAPIETSFQVDRKGLKTKRLFFTLVELLRSLSQVGDRANRLRSKSLAGLLDLQEKLQARWSRESSCHPPPMGLS